MLIFFLSFRIRMLLTLNAREKERVKCMCVYCIHLFGSRMYVRDCMVQFVTIFLA